MLHEPPSREWRVTTDERKSLALQFTGDGNYDAGEASGPTVESTEMNADQQRFNWQQPTPIMQLRAITGSVEGYTSNWRERILPERAYAMRAASFSDELMVLLPYVEKGTWQ